MAFVHGGVSCEKSTGGGKLVIRSGLPVIWAPKERPSHRFGLITIWEGLRRFGGGTANNRRGKYGRSGSSFAISRLHSFEGLGFLGSLARSPEGATIWSRDARYLQLVREHPKRIDFDEWHTFKASVRGPRIQCFVDEDLIFDLTDGRHQTGYVALGSEPDGCTLSQSQSHRSARKSPGERHRTARDCPRRLSCVIGEEFTERGA